MKGLCLILRKSSSYAKNKFALQKPTLLAQKKCGIICLEKSNIAEKDAHIVAAGFNGVIRLIFHWRAHGGTSLSHRVSSVIHFRRSGDLSQVRPSGGYKREVFSILGCREWHIFRGHSS